MDAMIFAKGEDIQSAAPAVISPIYLIDPCWMSVLILRADQPGPAELGTDWGLLVQFVSGCFPQSSAYGTIRVKVWPVSLSRQPSVICPDVSGQSAGTIRLRELEPSQVVTKKI